MQGKKSLSLTTMGHRYSVTFLEFIFAPIILNIIDLIFLETRIKSTTLYIISDVILVKLYKEVEYKFQNF